MANTEIDQKSLETYVRMVFNISHDTKTSDSRLMNQVLPLFEGGRGNDLFDVRGTFFAAYNAAQEYLQDVKGDQASNRLDSIWFGESAILNRKALAVAVEMAQAV